MRTVLVTGASGLLGTWLRRTAPAEVAVVGLTRRTRRGGSDGLVADLRAPDATHAVVARARPALVLHAAYALDEASIAGATQNVVDAARSIGADVVQVSTDAVFSGDGARRREDATPDPIWDYGRWKARAEQIVTEGVEASAVVRLPLIVSLDPDDHVVARIRRGAAREEPTTWFDDELRQPAAASDIAHALWRIALLPSDERAGTWHLPGPETLSRYQIAQRVVSALGLEADTIEPAQTPPSADRPRHLDLADDRARARIGWSPPSVLGGR